MALRKYTKAESIIKISEDKKEEPKEVVVKESTTEDDNKDK